MIIEETPLQDCYILKPKVFEDQRGYFFETYNTATLKDTVLGSYNWVQENESKSGKGVLRGLHFQKGDFAQSKLVRVITGQVFDVAVDLRKDSPTFGQSYSVLLSEKNKTQFLIPRGFAHGFLVLSDIAVFSYKCDNLYNAKEEAGVIYDDEALGIKWPELDVAYLLSEKDKTLPSYQNCYKF
ncbi:MAG: dTDP-4-dehydrorhamnose 3,5-epimerase [Roseivirga sp.]